MKINHKIRIEDRLDNEGDLELVFIEDDAEYYAWLERQDAAKLVDHLTKLFSLDNNR